MTKPRSDLGDEKPSTQAPAEARSPALRQPPPPSLQPNPIHRQPKILLLLVGDQKAHLRDAVEVEIREIEPAAAKLGVEVAELEPDGLPFAGGGKGVHVGRAQGRRRRPARWMRPHGNSRSSRKVTGLVAE